MTRKFVMGLLVLCASPACSHALSAQRPDNVPPLDSLVSSYVRQDRRQPLYLVGVCPAQNPYGDRLMLRLMQAEQSPRIVGALAVSWRSALASCGDPRIGVWYRARLAEARNASVVNALVAALLSHQTPANIAAVRSAAFDGRHSGELRSTILFSLGRTLSPEQKVELFVDLYRQPGRMPEPYAITERTNLIRGPQGELFVSRVLEAVLAAPNQPDANEVLANVADDVHTGVARDRPRLRQRVLEALDRAAANRDRLPQDMVDVARHSAAVLRERPAGRMN